MEATAGTVVYVHGYYTNVDQAWADHKLAEQFLEAFPAFALLPEVETLAEALAGDGEDGGVEQSEPAQVQHHFGDATSQVSADGGVVLRSVGQDVDQAGRGAIDGASVQDHRVTAPTAMTDPRVVVLILNTNKRDDTLACLRSLAHATWRNLDVIVLDNGSTDGSKDAILRRGVSVLDAA